MRPALLLPILGLWTLVHALPITTTNPEPAKSRLQSRKFNPLPNPYDVPGTPITLDFDDHPDAYLPMSDISLLLARVQQHVRQHIQQYGDGEIPLGIQIFRIKSVEIMFDSSPHFRIMYFSDVLSIIRGLRQKTLQEGSRERTAIVTYRFDDGREVETGEVDIGRIGQSLSSTA